MGIITKDEIVALIIKRFPDIDINYKDLSFGGDMRDIHVSFNRLKKALDFKASLTVDDGIRELTQALKYGLIKQSIGQALSKHRLDCKVRYNIKWSDTNFWKDKKVVVTGGVGFLGNFVIQKLKEHDVTNIFIPTIEEYDLVQPEAIDRLFNKLLSRMLSFIWQPMSVELVPIASIRLNSSMTI